MDIGAWFRGLPLFTRYWFALSVAFPLLGRIGLVNPHILILNQLFMSKFQIWRPFTALFFYPIGPGTGFHYLMNLYFLYNYSVRLERDTFTGRPADYLFMLIFNWASIVLIAYWMNISLLMDPMVLSVLYIWCQLNKDVIVNFWFGTQFKAALLPWVLLGFNLILSGGGLYEIIGILVGHMYYFVMYKYPQDYGGPALIQTPSILYNYFPNYSARGGVTSGSAPNPRRADTNTARGTGTGTGTGGGGTGAFPYAWGRGNTLGGN